VNGMTVDNILEMEGICKDFPGVHALSNVDLAVKRGEIHAVVGENGAGKSTLMKIVSGAYRKDRGRIVFRGQPVEIRDPLDAQALGIAIIYQEFSLAPHLSAGANIFIGHEPRGLLPGFIDFRKIHMESVRLFSQLGVDIDPATDVRKLSVCQQQITEIARALLMATNLLVMDEPTSALPEEEVRLLFSVIRRLQAEGMTILYISHNLDEVFEIADRITVLRDGVRIDTVPTDGSNREAIIRMMVGRDIQRTQVRSQVAIGDEILRVADIRRAGAVDNVSFSLQGGEILGIGGLLGAGRTELLRCIFGADRKHAGSVFVGGHAVEINQPLDAVRAGIGFVPEDRKQQGLFLGLAVRNNLTVACMDRIATRGFLHRRAETELVDHYIRSLDIRVSSQEQRAVNLSGGNQQKVILSRWMALEPRVLLLDDPTRGIDIGARASIHELIKTLADQGLGVIFVSSELPELLEICDRILVMAGGTLVAEFPRAEATQEKILLHATGTMRPAGCAGQGLNSADDRLI
jgi:ribose transport system ATP-binding protein